MRSRAVLLSAVASLATLGVGLAAQAHSISYVGAHQSGKASYGVDLLAQGAGGRVVTLTAQDRGTHINLRSQPTVRSRAIGYGLPGDQVSLLECVQDTDTRGSDLNWCRVRFPRSGAVGWIRSDFIIFSDDGE